MSGLCTIDGCGKSAATRGMCNAHYLRLRRRGLLSPSNRSKWEPIEAKLLRNVEMIPEAGCWIWTGACLPNGYGSLGDRYAHRLSWEVFRAAIPAGAFVLHKCDVRCCCNPNHLFIGTQLENLADCKRKGRTTFGERNAMAKLSTADVLAIKERRTSGEGSEAIARDYNINPRHVRRLMSGERWGHL